jgi:hypothetical protein
MGRTAPTPDTSTSTVTDVCSVVTDADLDSAFGGKWYPDPASNTDPLTCNYTDFQLTQAQASSLLKTGSAVTIELWPNYYAKSDMGRGQSVAGLGEEASILGNTLTIKRGADVIVILAAPADASPAVQGAMVALGQAIYPRF